MDDEEITRMCLDFYELKLVPKSSTVIALEHRHPTSLFLGRYETKKVLPEQKPSRGSQREK